MSFRFDGQEGLIVVLARIWGPAGNTVVRLALDTGATTTMIGAGVLATVGYDPVSSTQRVRMTTASDVYYVAKLAVSTIQALGIERSQLEVVSHTLPPSASVDGLLGLDFLRGHELSIDFRAGEIELT